MRNLVSGLLLLCLSALLTHPARAQDLVPEVTDKKPNPTVNFAKSWDDAVAEAKLLNVPIVVHSHGFY
jgi:hypothetical protein